MVVRYFNSYEDLLALQKFVLRNSAVGKKAMFHRFLAVELVVLFVCLMFAVNHNRFYVLLAFLFISGLAWLFRERSVMMQFKKDFKRGLRKDPDSVFHRQKAITIAPEEFSVEMGGHTNDHRWDSVELISADERYVYMVLKGVMHYVVPKNSFESSDDAKRFMERIREYRAAAHTSDGQNDL